MGLGGREGHDGDMEVKVRQCRVTWESADIEDPLSAGHMHMMSCVFRCDRPGSVAQHVGSSQEGAPMGQGVSNKCHCRHIYGLGDGSMALGVAGVVSDMSVCTLCVVTHQWIGPRWACLNACQMLCQAGAGVRGAAIHGWRISQGESFQWEGNDQVL